MAPFGAIVDILVYIQSRPPPRPTWGQSRTIVGYPEGTRLHCFAYARAGAGKCFGNSEATARRYPSCGVKNVFEQEISF